MDRDEFERRRAERRRAINFIELAVVDAKGDVLFREMGRTLDVSAIGIRLEIPALLEVGQGIRVSLGLKDDMIDLQGRVAHTELVGEGLFSAGIEFTQIDEEGEQVLERYLQDFRAEFAGSVP